MKPLHLCILAVASIAVLSVGAQERPRGDEPRDNKAERLSTSRQEKTPHSAETRKTSQVPNREKRTWMGIATSPIPEPLRDYLEVDEGFGIQVVRTMEDSPADKAGVKENDVIVRLDDQWLISPEHLSLLVRRQAKDDKVTLHVLRKGKELALEVTLGESEVEIHSRRHFPGPMPSPHRGNPHAWQEAMKKQQDYWNEWMKKHRAEGEKIEGRPPSVTMKPGFPVKVFGTEGVVKIDNEKGELTITNEDGEHQIVIKDAEGSVVHEGAFDPDKGTDSLPEAARKQLREMKLDDLKVLSPESPRPTPEKTAAPTVPEDSAESKAEKPKELL